jgi:hypothetical protein
MCTKEVGGSRSVRWEGRGGIAVLWGVWREARWDVCWRMVVCGGLRLLYMSVCDTCGSVYVFGYVGGMVVVCLVYTGI